jgi:hypothetical protein
MKSNALDAMVKPINANSISPLVHSFNIQNYCLFCKKNFKLVVIAMVQVFGSVEMMDALVFWHYISISFVINSLTT